MQILTVYVDVSHIFISLSKKATGNYAYISGYRSARHSKQGTWLIRALVYALCTYTCDRDIQSIFEEVIVYTIQ